MLEDFAQAVVERAQRNLGATRMVKGKKRRSVSTGALKSSLTYTIKFKARSTSILFGASGSARKYAHNVEEGRKPNSAMPPVSAIEKWIKQKPIKLRGPKGGFVRATPEKIRSLAFAIAKSIGTNGIEANPYFEDAIKDELELRGKDFEQELEKDLNIYLEKLWQ